MCMFLHVQYGINISENSQTMYADFSSENIYH